jgi:DNA-binding MarR family transcriptional regulator
METLFDLDPVRPPSRRNQIRPYGAAEPAVRRLAVPTALPEVEEAQLLLGVAPRQAAITRRLREADIDLALARLVMQFPDDRPMRVLDIAWALGVSRQSAIRLLDTAESAALLDKLPCAIDRRGVYVRLTSKGRQLQHHVQTLISSTHAAARPKGKAYGGRSYWGDPEPDC